MVAFEELKPTWRKREREREEKESKTASHCVKCNCNILRASKRTEIKENDSS